VLPFTRVRIVGASMEPALRNSEWWLVRRTSRIRPGDVVLLTHPVRPNMVIVKRLVRRDPEGWWVLGDNVGASDDSRTFGAVPEANLIGRLFVRYSPLRRRS
jgi:nickel-type superoxide dismutase maturation protease